MARTKADCDKMLHDAYDAYYDFCYRYCLVRTRNAKGSEEDSVQNAFLIYYKRLLAGDSFENAKAFLYRTCENMCRRADTAFLKNAKRSVTMDNITELAEEETDRLAAQLDYDIIKEKLLLLLSDEEQELFRLKYEQKKTLAQIADILQISPNAVALRTSRLRKKVKTLVNITIDTIREEG